MATTPSLNKKEALLAFIDAYRSRPELWDVKNPSYSNRAKKVSAYQVLVEKLKVIEPDATRKSVVKKINNLRSAFRKELKKIENSTNSGASSDVYVPALWYFQDLMFLVDQETSDHSNTTMGEGVEDNKKLVITSGPASSSPTISTFAEQTKKRKPIDSTSTAQNLLAKAIRYLETEDDECLTLAKGYATKLRKLTPEQLMFADKVINDALCDAQLGFLTRNSYLIHPVPSTSQQTSPTWSSDKDNDSAFSGAQNV